jgi:hypothetical protein
MLEESSPGYFLKTRPKRLAKKLTKKDKELINKFLGKEDSDILQFFGT